LTRGVSLNRIITETEKEGELRIKILVLVFLCLFLFVTGGVQFSRAKEATSIQEDPEITELKKKQRYTMMDIRTITTALADYVSDNGVAPKQDGPYDENLEFIKALAPFYVRNLPVHDGWFNPYLVYCGEACNGKYGISGCGADDFVVVSYGRDKKKEAFTFNPSNPEAGIFEIESAEDFDKDLIMWNGSWVRAPRPRRR